MPTIKIEVSHDQLDWLKANTLNINNFMCRLLTDEIYRTSCHECTGLDKLIKPFELGERATTPAILELAREYVNTCRQLSALAKTTHKYTRAGADIFGVYVPGSIRSTDGALPLMFSSGLRLSAITFNTGIDRNKGTHWIGFNVRRRDPMRHTFIMRQFDTATEEEGDRLAEIFDHYRNPNTGAYEKETE